MATPYSSIDPLAVQAKRVTDVQIDPMAPARGVQTGLVLGEQVQEAELGKQFQMLLQGGQEAMNQTAKQVVEQGLLPAEDVPDPNQPAFQKDENTQLAWYQGIAQMIQQRQAAQSRAQEVEMMPEERIKSQYVRGVRKPEEFEKEMTDIEDKRTKEATLDDIQAFVESIPEEELIDLEPAVLASRAAIKNPRMNDEESIKTIIEMIEERRDREATKEIAKITAKQKEEERRRKREISHQELVDSLDLITALAESVEPSGPVIGRLKGLMSYWGLYPKISSLRDWGGIIATQLAKRIGGETGRLTDQDRMFALAILPRPKDTKEERRIKMRLIEAFKNENLNKEDLRDAIYGGAADIYRTKHNTELPTMTLKALADIPNGPTERQLDSYMYLNEIKPTSENRNKIRDRLRELRGKEITIKPVTLDDLTSTSDDSKIDSYLQDKEIPITKEARKTVRDYLKRRGK